MARGVLNKSKLSEYDDSIYERVMQRKKEPFMYRVVNKIYEYIDLDLLMMSIILNSIDTILFILCVYSGLDTGATIGYFYTFKFAEDLIIAIILWYFIFRMLRKNNISTFNMFRVILLGRK